MMLLILFCFRYPMAHGTAAWLCRVVGLELQAGLHVRGGNLGPNNQVLSQYAACK